MLLNLLLAAVVAVSVQLWPAPPLEASAPPLQVNMVSEEPTPEPELTALGQAPKPTPPPYLRTEERQRQDKPPEEAAFQSDKDTANASEAPPTGELPVPSQDGRKLPTIEFDTREYVAGEKAADDAKPGPTPAPVVAQTQPAPTPRPVDPPRPQINREAPRPTPAPTPIAAAPTPTPAPTPLAPRPEANEFALRAPTPPPVPTPDFRTAEPPRAQPVEPEYALARPRPLPPTTPPGSPGYRPQTIRTKMEGGLTTRGPSSIAARDTPLGRYQKAMSDAIGSRWYFGMQQNSDTVQSGTVKVRFYVDPTGHVRRPEIIQGTSGSSLATVSITAVLEASLPPMPPEIASALLNNQMEVDFTFSSL